MECTALRECEDKADSCFCYPALSSVYRGHRPRRVGKRGHMGADRSFCRDYGYRVIAVGALWRCSNACGKVEKRGGKCSKGEGVCGSFADFGTGFKGFAGCLPCECFPCPGDD